MAEGREFIISYLNGRTSCQAKTKMTGQGQQMTAQASTSCTYILQWLMVCCRESAGLYLSSQQFRWPIMTKLADKING